MLFQTFFWYWVYLISARSQPECTNKHIEQEPERQHRLGILSGHLYDSISDPTVHTYLALCSQYLKLNIITKKHIMLLIINNFALTFITLYMIFYVFKVLHYVCWTYKLENNVKVKISQKEDYFCTSQ